MKDQRKIKRKSSLLGVFQVTRRKKEGFLPEEDQLVWIDEKRFTQNFSIR